MGIERRRYPRLEGEFRVDLLNMGDDPSIPNTEPVVPAKALDISKEGLRLQSAYNAPLDGFVSAVVYYRSQPSFCLCKIVWKRAADGQQLYGLHIASWSKLDLDLAHKLRELDTEISSDVPASAPLRFALA